jgi:hypothetical protein
MAMHAPLLRPPSLSFAATFAVATWCLTAAVQAQWTATVLHPAGGFTSSCDRVQDGVQVGEVDYGSAPQAALWTGTVASYTDLHPAGALYSRVYGIAGTRQVGYSYPGNVAHAALWTGSSSSYVDLNPNGSTESTAFDIAGNTIAGQANVGTLMQACIWDASTLAWTSLQPVGISSPPTWSVCRSCDAWQQAGSAVRGGQSHAAVWSGSGGSFVDLHPAAVTSSAAYDVDTGQQVGRTTTNFLDRAALWSGSAASWVDLQPAGTTRSTAYGVHLGEQVGYAQIGGVFNHAGLWHGTAASWEDLHSYLPASFTASQAFGIWHDIYGTTYVVGAGNEGGHQKAVMWVKHAPIWSNLGFAKPGVSGPPVLGGTGPLTTNSLTSLALTNAHANATAVLIMGVLPANVPFLGGILVPDPVILVPLTTDAAGSVTWQVNLPSLPAGLPLRFQHWIDDPTVSYGWSASNGLLGICQ